MNIAKDLDRKIEKKKQDIALLEKNLGESRAYLQALEDMRKMLPKEPNSNANFELRPGSVLAEVKEQLRIANKPLHIDDLLKRIGKGSDKKVSLAGSLATYVRDGKIFTRPAPNTFGLLEFDRENGEPPANFGVIQAEEA